MRSYADAGEDIVCAAVSALTQGTLNGLLNVLKAPVDYHIDEKDGILTAALGEVPEGKRAGAQLLLQTLASALQMIEADYARFHPGDLQGTEVRHHVQDESAAFRA